VKGGVVNHYFQHERRMSDWGGGDTKFGEGVCSLNPNFVGPKEREVEQHFGSTIIGFAGGVRKTEKRRW